MLQAFAIADILGSKLSAVGIMATNERASRTCEPATPRPMLDRSWAPPRNVLTLVQVALGQPVIGRVLSRRGYSWRFSLM